MAAVKVKVLKADAIVTPGRALIGAGRSSLELKANLLSINAPGRF